MERGVVLELPGLYTREPEKSRRVTNQLCATRLPTPEGSGA
jgi:hypothetical protein